MAEDFVSITDHDVKDPNLLLRTLRSIVRRLGIVGDRVDTLAAAPQPPTYGQIQQQLQVNGDAPLNVQALLGTLAEPQLAKLLTFTTAPTGQALQQLKDAQLIDVTGTADQLYRVVGGNPNTLAIISPIVSAASLPATVMYTDTIQTVTAAKTFAAGAFPILAGSGGANQFVKQSTAGGAITVGVLGAGDVPDAALSSNVVLKTGIQTISGQKTLSDYLTFDSTGSSYLYLRISGANDGYIGMSGAADSIIPGTILGSLALRTSAGKSILFSTDGGTSADMRIVGGKFGIGMVPSKTLDVTGTFGITGAATLGAATTITGAATLSSTLAVTGATTLTNKITSYNGDTTSGNGVASVVYKTYLTGQTASIGATTMYTPTVEGEYRLSYNIITTTAGTGSIFLTGSWTDELGTRSTATISTLLIADAQSQGSLFFHAKVTAAIKFSTTYSATGTYAIAVTLERIS